MRRDGPELGTHLGSAYARESPTDREEIEPMFHPSRAWVSLYGSRAGYTVGDSTEPADIDPIGIASPPQMSHSDRGLTGERTHVSTKQAGR